MIYLKDDLYFFSRLGVSYFLVINLLSVYHFYIKSKKGLGEYLVNAFSNLLKTGIIYAYAGLGSISVKKGDYAMFGTSLGTVGIDPISKKSQITLMVFQNGQPIDPAKAPRS